MSKSTPSTAPENNTAIDNYIHVVAAVIIDSQGKVLIAKRPDHLHQGGLWEFPGGKIESSETSLAALKRELIEEVNITVTEAEPLIQIPWHYKDKAVLLDVFKVEKFMGKAAGLEGQEIEWVGINELYKYTFPAANYGILHALTLPQAYLITGQFKDLSDFSHRLKDALNNGVRLIQLRIKSLPENDQEPYIKSAIEICKPYDGRLLINSSVELAKKFNMGLHLNSHQLMMLEKRPFERNVLVAASVHNDSELKKANSLGVDFIVISPVNKTTSHPGQQAMGWEGFKNLVSLSSCPAYALGGMGLVDTDNARMHGAQGVAAIREFWQ